MNYFLFYGGGNLPKKLVNFGLCPLIMNRYLLPLLLLLLSASDLFPQQIAETNTDQLYSIARQEYKAGNFQVSLDHTQKGLSLAPSYHDIRILQVRNLWALDRFPEADEDLHYLLTNSPNYVDLPPLVQQRINYFIDNSEALKFVENAILIYPHDIFFKVKKAELLMRTQQTSEARSLAKDLLSEEITSAQRYLLETILNRTVRNRVGLNYQYIGFSEDYTRRKPWSSVSAEYQRSIGQTVLLGRTTFSDRRYDQGVLYELEAYPIFSDRLYAFVNTGFSEGDIFPDFRGSLSIHYNFAKSFEAEAGSRIQAYGSSTFFTAIAGLTAYTGKFYLNSRVFLGPERNGDLIQNYQFNTRYYLKNAENYLFLRLGSGISPDETALSTLLLDNPTLDAWYANIGINKTLGIHHIIKAGVGFLHEDITSQRSGTQFIGNIGYYYSF